MVKLSEDLPVTGGALVSAHFQFVILPVSATTSRWDYAQGSRVGGTKEGRKVLCKLADSTVVGGRNYPTGYASYS